MPGTRTTLVTKAEADQRKSSLDSVAKPRESSNNTRTND